MMLSQRPFHFTSIGCYCALIIGKAILGVVDSAKIPNEVYSVRERFLWQKDIKSGNEGTVVLVKDFKDKQNPTECALKFVEHSETSQGFLNEVTMLRKVQQFAEVPKLIYPEPSDKANVVAHGKDVKTGKTYDFYAMSLVGLDMLTLLMRGREATKPFINAGQAARWFVQTVHALRHLHSQGILHGDPHVNNICFNLADPSKIVLIDFTKAASFDASKSILVGKRGSPHRDYVVLKPYLVSVFADLFPNDAHVMARFPKGEAMMNEELDALTAGTAAFENFADFQTKFADKFLELLTKDVKGGKKAWFPKAWLDDNGPIGSNWKSEDNVKPVSTEEFAMFMMGL